MFVLHLTQLVLLDGSFCMYGPCMLATWVTLQQGHLRLMSGAWISKALKWPNLMIFSWLPSTVLNMEFLPRNHCAAHALPPLSQALWCVWRHLLLCWPCYKVECSSTQVGWVAGGSEIHDRRLWAVSPAHAHTLCLRTFVGIISIVRIFPLCRLCCLVVALFLLRDGCISVMEWYDLLSSAKVFL